MAKRKLEESLSDTNIENSIVYDLEPDKNSDTKAVEALTCRVRFYHAKIDGDNLRWSQNNFSIHQRNRGKPAERAIPVTPVYGTYNGIF